MRIKNLTDINKSKLSHVIDHNLITNITSTLIEMHSS